MIIKRKTFHHTNNPAYWYKILLHNKNKLDILKNCIQESIKHIPMKLHSEIYKQLIFISNTYMLYDTSIKYYKNNIKECNKIKSILISQKHSMNELHTNVMNYLNGKLS